MGRARVVAPPPQDYIPEPLVAPPPPPEIVEEQEWIEGNLEEEIIEAENNEPSQEELERERIAEELINLRHDLTRQMTIANEHVNENEMLREENERLTREKEAAEKAREEQILKVRQQATEQRSSQNQLNILQVRKPSLVSKLKSFLKQRRIKSATNISHMNYEQAIIHQASVAVPRMLDDMEKMHENLVILEELLIKHKERLKITESETHPRQ
jgi:hypothetical protein